MYHMYVYIKKKVALCFKLIARRIHKCRGLRLCRVIYINVTSPHMDALRAFFIMVMIAVPVVVRIWGMHKFQKRPRKRPTKEAACIPEGPVADVTPSAKGRSLYEGSIDEVGSANVCMSLWRTNILLPWAVRPTLSATQCKRPRSLSSLEASASTCCCTSTSSFDCALARFACSLACFRCSSFRCSSASRTGRSRSCCCCSCCLWC